MVYCLVNPLIAELFSLIAKVCLLISLNMSFTFVISTSNFLLIGFFTREGIGLWLINQSAKEFIFDRTLFPKSLKTRLKRLFHGLGTCVHFGTSIGTCISITSASNTFFVALFIYI